MGSLLGLRTCSARRGYNRRMARVMSCIPRTDEHLSRVLIDTLPNPVCIVDSRNRVRFVNRRALGILGDMSPDELVGHSLFEFVAPEDRERAERDLERCTTHFPSNPHEYHIVDRNGERIPIVVTAAALACGKKDECIVCVGAAQSLDMSRGREQLPHSRGMMYLDILRHDIGNQLQIILSSIELLMENKPDECKQSELLSNVLEAVDCCQKIIGYTEDIERLVVEPLRPRRVDLAVRKAIVGIYEERADVDLQASLGVAEGTVMADRFLESLIKGLINELCECNPRKDKWVSVDIDETETEYLIEVSDNGCGLQPNSDRSIFNERNVQDSPGIHFCHAIIQKYRGRLSILEPVLKTPHRGIRARITLPRSESSRIS
ncbi:PAS domain-containing protein [Candidatus Thorarchaeota archaeon]|nr:MAG: PAS domain-containing protein [Candidatus Thorarchaeota archaeon]